jgi:hypothetical protein
MKIELETLVARVVTWPEAAQDDFVSAVRQIEAAHGMLRSRCGNGQVATEQGPMAGGNDASLAEAETEAFFKRHGSSFL